MCVHKCMQESNVELPVLPPKIFPHAGKKMTKRLTVAEENSKVLSSWPAIENKTSHIVQEIEFHQILKNSSDVGRDQVIALMCALSVCNTAFEWDVLRQLRRHLTLNKDYNHTVCSYSHQPSKH